MAENDSKKTNPKGKCEVCDKEMLKSSLKTHMKSQHDKKNEESNKRTELNEDKEDDGKSEDTVEKIEPTTVPKKIEPTKKTDPATVPKKVQVVHNLINLDTKELESLLAEEEEFLDAVEMVEDAEILGNLEVDLSVNQSMVDFIVDPKNYQSDYAKTLELEKSLENANKAINEDSKKEKELENAKKTIAFLRNLNLKDKKYVQILEKECANGAKEYKDLEKRYKSSKLVIKMLEQDLKSNRVLLAKASTENIQVKHKLDTKVSLEEATNENNKEEVIVIDNDDPKQNMLRCDKCDFVAKYKEVMLGHNKFIHLDCHVCRKHCSTVTELNSHIEHVHNIKPFDCAWCLVSFPNHTGFEVHRQEEHEETLVHKCNQCALKFMKKEHLVKHVTHEHVSRTHKCDKCPSTFQKKEQLLNHAMKEHVIICIFKTCGLIVDTEVEMINHLDKEHLVNASGEDIESNKNTQQKECRHFKKGKCVKGNQCKFKHIKGNYKCEKCEYTANTTEGLTTHIKTKHEGNNEKNNSVLCRNGDKCIHKARNKCRFFHEENRKQNGKQSNQICTRGDNCVFKKRGNCFYYHEDVGVQVRREPVKTQDRKSEIYCKFQENCTNSACKFKHFNSNFAQKSAPRKNPTLSEWLRKN